MTPGQIGPRVVIDPGSHALLNIGDVTMLRVCLDRLRERWPGVVAQVLTTDPDALARLCPGAVPLAAAGRYALLDELDSGPRAASVPRSRLASLAARVGRRLRPPARRLPWAEPELSDVRSGPAGELIGALLGADLLLVAGRGGMADAFKEDGLAVLGLVELGADLGVPVAMVGQGLGPARDEQLLSRARRVLPRVGLIAVRERLHAPALLEALGVDMRRVAVTGDDAVEPALALRQERTPEPLVGVSLRFIHYYGIGREDIQRLSEALERVGHATGGRLLALPISRHPYEADAEAIAAIVRSVEPGPPEDTMRRAGECRVVVTATYHAGVFALSQGVPVVCVARSDYQGQKLRGLADQFGAGCVVLELDDPDFSDRLVEQVSIAWGEGAELRDALAESARRQVEAGRSAYAAVARLLPS
ncbi:MAG: polysaccharide pyruvyl transferase family protein [Thermoleophilaceae bacterium]